MSLWSKIGNSLRGDSVSRDLQEEMQSHIDEAVRRGRDPEAARRAFGSALRLGEESRDLKVIAWLDALRADAVFGWRRITKHKVTTVAAVLSLGLAIGACTAAFRLIDAVLLRPLPIAHPEQLYSLGRSVIVAQKNISYNGWAYPDFAAMRTAAKDQAELIAASNSEQYELTFRSDQDFEKAYMQYVSSLMFSTFGLRPAAGRLLIPDDDTDPGKHPYAVISNDFWSRRFGRDPKVVGKTFRLSVQQVAGVQAGGVLYEIVGVIDGPFSGTEPGTMTDVFLPVSMNVGLTRDDWTWISTLAVLKPSVKPGASLDALRVKLEAVSNAWEAERVAAAKLSAEQRRLFASQKLTMDPAAAGMSGLQASYRPALIALGVLVALVLAIACANVANLMAAQAASRAREMALRVSIGAGRRRLVQLVMIESAWLAFFAAVTGALFAWWSAPLVVSKINPPDHPARIALPLDWRVLAFGLALTVAVTLFFGLAPALRASSVRPMAALRGGESPHARRRAMNALIALQVAFCFVVLFAAGLFASTFQRLSAAPMNFSADRVQQAPGVQRAALCGMPLLGGSAWNGFVTVAGTPASTVMAYFLNTSPGWLDAMGMSLVEGRDLLPNEASPGAAVVNETFVREYFGRERALGKTFAKGSANYVIVGIVRDAPYRSLREGIVPVAYVPFHEIDNAGVTRSKSGATLIVRSAGPDPMALASMLRQEIPHIRPEMRVSSFLSQADLIRAQTVRERLLAALALFFAAVALLLAGVGLYGVLDYSVLQRRKEIGIRMAIGARAASIARLVTTEIALMIAAGSAAGLVVGLASARYIETLLYNVKATDATMLAWPAASLVAVALIATLPAIRHAVRIDPASMLKSE